MNTDKYLLSADKAICKNISLYPALSRGEICVNILSQLRNFTEHLMIGFIPPTELPLDEYKQICKGIQYAKKVPEMRDVVELHDLLEKSSSHYTYSEDVSERLVLKYFPFLYRIRETFKTLYGLSLLSNLQDFPLDLDKEDRKYYENIAHCYERSKATVESKSDRFYVRKTKPFIVDGKLYYELTLAPAVDRASKFDHLIAFTDKFINTKYAVEIKLVHADVNVFGVNVSTTLAINWKVQIRGCEFANFAEAISGSRPEISPTEMKRINDYLTSSRKSLVGLIAGENDEYDEFEDEVKASGKVHRFLDVLDLCRTIVLKNRSGSNVIRYLLLTMNNKVIKSQQNWNWSEEDHERQLWKNKNLSYLYLNWKCRAFDSLPYYFSMHDHNPRFIDLLHCIPLTGHEDELLARFVRTNTESNCRLRTSLKDCEANGFLDVDDLIKSFNSKLIWDSAKPQKISYDGQNIYIDEYLQETALILKTLESQSNFPVKNYSDFVSERLKEFSISVDDPEKLKILNELFADTHVGLIYGPAGTGKTFLMSLISKVFVDNKKVYVAQTNPAVNNLRRRMPSDTNSQFMTVESYKNQSFLDKHILLMDEASTVSNSDMKQILAKTSFKALILVGDTHQIASIRFGNWFSLAESFLKENCIYHLDIPFRAKGTPLIELWRRVRTMEPGIEEFMAHHDYSCELDEGVLKPLSGDEIVLCLNYDGLYGINNINRYMQANNKGKAEEWGGKIYKIGDPILFNENDRFEGVLYNNLKGTIANIETDVSADGVAHIVFFLEVDTSLTEFDSTNDLEVLESPKKGKSLVKLVVDQRKDYDNEEFDNNRVIVPFDVAYAVSIHKAQGLEYESVKVILTKETEEEIGHNIFYTAITRATRNLKIYWSSETEHKILSTIKPLEANKDLGFVRNYLSDADD
jgi:hypothetical protein